MEETRVLLPFFQMSQTVKFRVSTALVSACIAMSGVAFGQEASTDTGRFSHEAAVELTWDNLDADAGDVSVIAAKVEYGAQFEFGEGWTVETALTFEPVEDSEGDSVFENQGLFAEELKLHYAGDTFSVYAGKFNPVFSSAAGLAPGLYGAEIGEAYETTEKVGFGGDIKLPVEGEHVLSAAVFTADRSFLSESIGTQRPAVELADGGPGNTEGLESYAISLDGQLTNGVGYSLGYRSLAAAQPGDEVETGLVGGVSYSFGTEDGIATDTFAEVASFDNADGVADAQRTFYTAGLTVTRAEWHAAAIVSGSNDNDVAGGADLNRFELSLGRDFGPAVLDAGVQFIEEDGERSTLFGLRLSFGFGG